MARNKTTSLIPVFALLSIFAWFPGVMAQSTNTPGILFFCLGCKSQFTYASESAVPAACPKCGKGRKSGKASPALEWEQPWYEYCYSKPGQLRKECGRPLCEEARLRFPLLTLGSTTSNIMMDQRELGREFDRALKEYNAGSPDAPAHITDNVGGTMPAMLWLFSSGGTTTTGDIYFPLLGDQHVPGVGPASEYSAQAFVFLPKGEGTRVSLRGYEVKPGTEPALVHAMKNLAATRKLTPADVLRLALQQRRGDLREALLLAHNALRSLARAGDERLTGISPDPEFFKKNMAALRAGEDNAGPWYHLFGTAYFGVQARGDYAMMPLTAIPDATSKAAMTLWSKLTTLLGGDKTNRQESDVASLAANELEQFFRTWIAGRESDPEKYCFNVWGAQIAAWLYRGRVPRSGVDWKASAQTFEDFSAAATKAACDEIGSFMKKVKSDDSVTDPNLRQLYGLGVIVGSPVDSTWEYEGGRMIVDQQAADLRGFVPAVVTPFREPASETWGFLALVPRERPLLLKMKAVGNGPVHLMTFDWVAGRVATYVADVRKGERLQITFSPQQSAPKLEREGSAAVEPRIIALGRSAPAPAPSKPPPSPARPAAPAAPTAAWTFELPTAATGHLLKPGYPTRNFVLDLALRYNRPGTVLDTVGINEAPIGSFALSVDADGRLVFSIYDPGRPSAGRLPNGWHQLRSQSRLAPKTDQQVRIEKRKDAIALWVNGRQEARLALATALSGKPIFIGDFPGDDHWGSKYNIHPAMTGTVTVQRLGAEN